MTTDAAKPDLPAPPPARSAAVQSVRWTAVGNVLRSVLATLQLLVIARLVPVAEFGLIILVTSLMLLAQTISDAGLSTALIRFRDVTDDEKSSLYWLNAAIGLAMTIAANLAAPALAAFYAAPLLDPMLRVASIMFLTNALFLQLRVLAERELRFDAVVRVELVSSALGFVVAIGLALAGYGAFSVVWAQVATSLSLLAMSWVVLGRDWRPRLHFRAREVRRFLSYGTDMLLVNAAIAITVQLDILVAGRFFSKETFGSFSQPRDLSLKVMQAINPVITRVGLPVMAREQHDPVRVGQIYLKVVRMSSSVCFPVYAGLGFVGEDLLPRILGPQWTTAARLLPFIALWFAVRSTVNPLGTYLYALGRSRTALWYQLAFAVVVAGGSYVGAQFGPVALSLGMAAIYLFFLEICWVAILRPLSGVGFAAYHRQVYGPGLCSAGAVLAAWGVRAALPLPPLMALGTGLIVGAAVFVALNLLLNREGVDEVIGLIRRRAAPAGAVA